MLRDDIGLIGKLLREACDRRDAEEVERLSGELEDLREELDYLEEAVPDSTKERRERPFVW